MPMDIRPKEKNRKDTHPRIFKDIVLDFSSLLSNYTNLAGLYRLVFIANNCPLRRFEALKLAIANSKLMNCVTFYRTLHQVLKDILNENNHLGLVSDVPQFEQTWVNKATKMFFEKLEELEDDLSIYKSFSMTTESVRCVYDQLGDHYLEFGDLNKAFNNYSEACKYCTNVIQTINVYFNVIKVSIYLENWDAVSLNVDRAEQIFGFDEGRDANFTIFTKLKCAAGIAKLNSNEYKAAAHNFLQASFDHCNYSEVLSPNDVAIYGGLCALATYDRNELKKKVILNESFRQFLDLEPQLKDIIFMFSECKFTDSLRLLDEMIENLYLDIYISFSISTLFSLIRNRALTQYFSAYLSVDMTKMAVIFNTNISVFENELIQLILNGKIQARIDYPNKVLYAKIIDQRKATFQKSLASGKQITRNLHMKILRTAIEDREIRVDGLENKFRSRNFFKIQRQD